MKLSLIVPVFNQRLQLHSFFQKLAKTGFDVDGDSTISELELILVDDGSKDGSAEWLERFSNQIKSNFAELFTIPTETKLIRNPRHIGRGSSLRSGLSQSTGAIVATLIITPHFDPRELRALINPILQSRADVVFGSRFLATDTRPIEFFFRSLFRRTRTLIVNTLVNATFTDIASGYFAIRGPIARSLRLVASGSDIDVEIPVKTVKGNLCIQEVRIQAEYRGLNATHQVASNIGLHFLQQLFAIARFSFFGGSPWQPGLRQTLGALHEASDRFYCEPIEKIIQTAFKNDANSSNGWRSLRILEIGAGTGSITNALIHYGKVVASDIDPECKDYLLQRFKHIEEFEAEHWDATIPISSEATPKSIANGGFDLICAINVVEHIEDAKGALRNWGSILRPGGSILVLVPFSQALYCPIDKAVGHVKRYTQSDLNALLAESGGNLVLSKYLNPLGIIGWIINGKILNRAQLPEGQVRLYRLVKPIIRPFELLLEKFIGLSIVSVAKWKN